MNCSMMKFITKILLVTLLALFVKTSDVNGDLTDAEQNFTQSLNLVLSDLNAEVAAKNHTFISEKLAQIRSRKLMLRGNRRISTSNESDSMKFKHGSKRKRLKQKCATLSGRFKGNGKPLRRVW